MTPVQWETSREAAERVRISKQAIQAAVKAGELCAYFVGNGRRDYRLDADDVDAWVKARAWEPRSTS